MSKTELRKLADETVNAAIGRLIDAMLAAGEDPTDQELWAQSKRTYLNALYARVQAERWRRP